MTSRLSWQDTFRAGQGPDVVRVLCEQWRALAGTLSPDSFNAKEHEADLTELLCAHLRMVQRDTRLIGKWSYEDRIGEVVRISPTRLKMSNRRRTDIQFYSDIQHPDPPLDLVFEFKKVGRAATRRKDYAGDDGMLRFITGIYAVHQPLAIMVGILLEHHDDCVPPLVRWLDGAEAKQLLFMETVGRSHRYIPSRFFPNESPFDTEHLRPSDKAPPHGTIVISHLFLGFPNPPAPGAKRQRRAALIAALDA